MQVNEPPGSRFDFYGVSVEILSRSPDLTERLLRDFSHFAVAPSPSAAAVTITANLGKIPREKIPAGLRGRRTRNCVIYDLADRRINDYDGEALVEYRFATDEAWITSEDPDRLHEVVYLVIHSRVGKRLDRTGLHRLHAMAVSLGNRVLVCTLPMGAGKTTLFLELTKDERVRILSDDSPLISRAGEARAFPVRIGVKPEALSRTLSHPGLDPTRRYDLRRMRYGLKHLFPVPALKNRVFTGTAERTILVAGRRTAGPGCEIKPCSALRIFPAVFMNLVVGVGLPMMREYFIEENAGDLATLARILVSRMICCIRLLRRAELFYVSFGDQPDRNALALKRLFDSERAPARRGDRG